MALSRSSPLDGAVVLLKVFEAKAGVVDLGFIFIPLWPVSCKWVCLLCRTL